MQETQEGERRRGTQEDEGGTESGEGGLSRDSSLSRDSHPQAGESLRREGGAEREGLQRHITRSGGSQVGQSGQGLGKNFQEGYRDGDACGATVRDASVGSLPGWLSAVGWLCWQSPGWI